MRWSTTVWPCSIRNSPPQSHRAAQRQSLQRQRNLGAALQFPGRSERPPPRLRRGCRSGAKAAGTPARRPDRNFHRFIEYFLRTRPFALAVGATVANSGVLGLAQQIAVRFGAVRHLFQIRQHQQAGVFHIADLAQHGVDVAGGMGFQRVDGAAVYADMRLFDVVVTGQLRKTGPAFALVIPFTQAAFGVLGKIVHRDFCDKWNSTLYSSNL